ncbi:MAG: hypothetical protein OXI43_13185 [Candidatus Poribacteria bacterium]|nr:hypothetical protein [Candidatus Poribacteria bacterium]
MSSQQPLLSHKNHGFPLNGADDRRGAADRLTSQKCYKPLHQLFIVKYGIYNLKNMITEELAAKVYEFAFSFAPLRLKGAPSSPGNLIAI